MEGKKVVELEFQTKDGAKRRTLEAGKCLFLLGRNGTGKSTLLYRWARAREDAVFITAHRQNWLQSSQDNLSNKSREEMANNAVQLSRRHDSQWKDHAPGALPSIALHDLIQAEVEQNRKIANAARANDPATAALVAEPSVLKRLNSLFSSAQLGLVIEVGEKSTVYASKGGAMFPVERLSDGERNALLLVSSVLTQPPGKLLLIDEPERHLHRAIVVPLIREMIAIRDDCMFVIATHDVELPTQLSNVEVGLVRSCEVNGEHPIFDIDFIQPSELDEYARLDILGARRKILFVEGELSSLDRDLYSALFPSISVMPKSGVRQVIDATRGVNATKSVHHAEALALIDRDFRTDEEVASLGSEIFALEAHSIESIFYDIDLVESVGKSLCALTGTLLPSKDAIDKTLAKVFEDHKDIIVLNALKSVAKKQVETWQRETLHPCINASKDPPPLNISVTSLINELNEKVKSAIANRDFRTLIRDYSVKSTGVPTQLVKQFGFRDTKQYQGTFLRQVQADADFRNHIIDKYLTCLAQRIRQNGG